MGFRHYIFIIALLLASCNGGQSGGSATADGGGKVLDDSVTAVFGDDLGGAQIIEVDGDVEEVAIEWQGDPGSVEVNFDEYIDSHDDAIDSHDNGGFGPSSKLVSDSCPGFKEGDLCYKYKNHWVAFDALGTPRRVAKELTLGNGKLRSKMKLYPVRTGDPLVDVTLPENMIYFLKLSLVYVKLDGTIKIPPAAQTKRFANFNYKKFVDATKEPNIASLGPVLNIGYELAGSNQINVELTVTRTVAHGIAVEATDAKVALTTYFKQPEGLHTLEMSKPRGLVTALDKNSISYGIDLRYDLHALFFVINEIGLVLLPSTMGVHQSSFAFAVSEGNIVSSSATINNDIAHVVLSLKPEEGECVDETLVTTTYNSEFMAVFRQLALATYYDEFLKQSFCQGSNNEHEGSDEDAQNGSNGNLGAI